MHYSNSLGGTESDMGNIRFRRSLSVLSAHSGTALEMGPASGRESSQDGFISPDVVLLLSSINGLASTRGLIDTHDKVGSPGVFFFSSRLFEQVLWKFFHRCRNTGV